MSDPRIDQKKRELDERNTDVYEESSKIRRDQRVDRYAEVKPETRKLTCDEGSCESSPADTMQLGERSKLVLLSAEDGHSYRNTYKSR